MGQASLCVLSFTFFVSLWGISPRSSKVPLSSISAFWYPVCAVTFGLWRVVFICSLMILRRELWVLGSHLFLCL